MSFILDALKKSESERQPQSSAEFASLPTAAAKSATPTWIWVAGLLLLINLAVLVGLLLRSNSEPTTTSMISEYTTTTESPLIEDQSIGNNFVDQVAVARRNPPPTQTDEPSRTSETSTDQADARVVPTLVSHAPETVDMENQYPSIHEMRAAGSINIPDLHLDIHVFSDVPEERFVFINMSKHREGSVLDEGPEVSEITPLGVLLNHAGNTFLLPRE